MTIEFTIFTKPNGILSKQISLNADGTINSDGSACFMSEGKAYRCIVEDIEHLAVIINTMGSNQALCLGHLPDDAPNEVVVALKDKVVDGGGVIARSNKYMKFRPDRHNIVALDFDLKDMPQHVTDLVNTKGGLWNAVVSVFPELSGVASVARLSTSSCLSTIDGRQFPNSGGIHVYIVIEPGMSPISFINNLFDRLWLNGFGWYSLNKMGRPQERTIIDRSVVGAARLMFEGAPVIGPGLIQDVAQRAARFNPGTVTPADRLFPLNTTERADLNRLKLAQRTELEPLIEGVLKQRIDALTSSGVALDVAQRKVFSNFKGELSVGDTLYFDDRNIGAVSVEDVINNPVQYDGKTLADPADGSSGKPGKAKFFANHMMINCFAHGSSKYRLPSDPANLFDGAMTNLTAVVRDAVQEELPDTEQSSTIHNVRVLLRSLPDFRDLFRYNSFLDQIEVLRKVPDVDHRHDSISDTKYPRPLLDVDSIRITARLQSSEMPKAKLTDVENAIKLIASSNPYNPLKQYLKDCLDKWDSVSRIETMLVDYAGAEDNEYVRGVSRMFMISLAARGINPGTKVDTMLIMEGDQGVSKSTFGKTLMHDQEWFSDSMPHDLTSRDAMQHLRGKWLVEVAEMSALNRNDANEMKQFLTRQVDRYRDPYAKYEKSHPRTACLYGTTNLSRYMKDETGNRRYWPVRCRGKVDEAGLAAVRDHLFGEAVYLHLVGVPHWPSREWEAQHCEPEQSSRAVGDSWEDVIEEFMTVWLSKGQLELGFGLVASLPQGWELRRSKGVLSVQDVMVGALGMIGNDKLDQRTTNRITSVLTRAKWEYCGDTKVGGRRVWRKKA